MERTPEGTPVGVDDPYEIAGVCDHLTDDGRCRYALAHAGNDPEFAAARRADGYACHVGDEERWRACPQFRSTTDGKTCTRCGIEEVRMGHDDSRPLLEEHHLQYGDADRTGVADDVVADHDDAVADHDDAGPHEITVSLCRWCHAKVHRSIARIDDDASPDPEAIAERERRRSRERSETGFETARERYDT